MKTLFCCVLAAGALTAALGADEAQPAAPAKPVKAVVLTPEERTEYIRLTREELVLNTRLAFLGELAEEHLKRCTNATVIGAAEKARFESDLAQELRSQSAPLLEQLNTLTKQRLAFETAHAAVLGPPPALGALDEGKPLNLDEMKYLSSLDGRLLAVRQELASQITAANGLSAELQTNTTAEAVGRVSQLLEDNRKQTRLWEREQAELELRKLEFRALRR